MNNLFRKTLSISGATILSLNLLSNVNPSYAQEDLLTSLIQVDSNNQESYVSPSKVINGTYWSDLEEAKASKVNENIPPPTPWSSPLDEKEETLENRPLAKNEYITNAIGVFPKYVLKPNQTAISALNFGNEDPKKMYPNVGITNSKSGLNMMGANSWFTDDTFYRFSLLAGKDSEMYLFQTTNTKAEDKIPDSLNPFKLTENEVLTQEEIKNPQLLQVLGDIKETNSSDSSKKGHYKVGDEVKLDFSVSAPWFKRLILGYVLSVNRDDWPYGIEKYLKNADALYDSQIVYTLELPKGLDGSNARATLSGLEGFDTKTSVRTDNGINILLVEVRMKKDLRNKSIPYTTFVEQIRKIDTSKVKVSISGLKIKSDIQKDTDLTMKCTAGGYFDFANYIMPGVPSPASEASVETNNNQPLSTDDYYNTNDTSRLSKAKRAYYRRYITLVAKQSNDGRDIKTPKDKPNMITYTFTVDKDQKPNNSSSTPSKNKPDRPNNSDESNPIKPDRIEGKDRVDTAIKISKKFYNRANTVIVVRHDLFPDSMTASVLAKLKDAPILLNWAKSLDPRVGEEIKRLGAKEIIIVGGPESVSENVRDQLKVYDEDKDVERIAGADRYGTSEMVARRVTDITGKKNTGVVVSGQVFPDALSVGTFASRDGYPILLVKKDSIPDRIKLVIKDLDITKTYIAGGLNTIDKSVETQLPKVIERMAGKNRYETSVAIANSKFKDSKDAFVASGIEFADALVISPISGKYNKPTLLVSTNKNSNIGVKKYIKDKMLETITAIGGEKYVPINILKDLITK